jgi:succinate dehydrogenase / fumarate reductase cytochrome b subunit
MRPRGTTGDASRLDHVAKQTEIDQVEAHGSLQSNLARGIDLPSNSTKESYARYLLSAKCLSIIFAIDESQDRRGLVDCGGSQLWLGTQRARARRRKAMAETKAPAERPLSPHLFIYKPTLTMTMSIVHRITGAGLYFGTLLVAWWLIAAASSPNAYAGVGSFMSSFVGRLILFGYTWALMHHMLGGIRHLIWDTGRGFGPHEREWLTVASLVGSISLTVVIWIVGYLFMGGPR